jgi:hypothetical protein
LGQGDAHARRQLRRRSGRPQGQGHGLQHHQASAPPNTIVFLTFTGYLPGQDDEGNTLDVPQYSFSYGVELDSFIISPHDHCDNANGGFAFAS